MSKIGKKRNNTDTGSPIAEAKLPMEIGEK
jgi:hypothetical protein